MIHYTIQCQEARAIFEPKTLKTLASDTLQAAESALQALLGQTLALLQIDQKTFVAFPQEEFNPKEIEMNFKNKCLHDDTFVLKIVEESKS